MDHLQEEHNLQNENQGSYLSLVQLLGGIIDSKLKFDEHVKSLCLEANRNSSALSSVANTIDKANCNLLYNSFVISNYRYSPLI